MTKSEVEVLGVLCGVGTNRFMDGEPTAIPVSFGSFGVLNAIQKQFSSGSVGYNSSGKIINPETGKRYQVTLNLVQIGSKPV
jgi:hypothetical protein